MRFGRAGAVFAGWMASVALVAACRGVGPDTVVAGQVLPGTEDVRHVGRRSIAVSDDGHFAIFAAGDEGGRARTLSAYRLYDISTRSLTSVLPVDPGVDALSRSSLLPSVGCWSEDGQAFTARTGRGLKLMLNVSSAGSPWTASTARDSGGDGCGTPAPQPSLPHRDAGWTVRSAASNRAVMVERRGARVPLGRFLVGRPLLRDVAPSTANTAVAVTVSPALGSVVAPARTFLVRETAEGLTASELRPGLYDLHWTRGGSLLGISADRSRPGVVEYPALDSGNSAAHGCREVLSAALDSVEVSYWDTSVFDARWNALRVRARDQACRAGLSNAEVLRGILHEFGRPGVRFLSASGLEAMSTELEGSSVVGLGLTELLSVDIDASSGRPVIITPVAGSPADAAGVRPGDALVAVAGRAVDQMDLGQVMQLLRRPEGTTVRLTLLRGDSTVDLTVRSRRLPPVNPVKSTVLQSGRRLGYLSLRQFAPGAADSVAVALRRLKAADIEALVLDLRENPGGLISELTRVAGQFMSGGDTVASLHGRGVVEHLRIPQGNERAASVGLPLAVLVNRGTASAAEALAGFLDARAGATVVGEETVRKGLAHSAHVLPDGSAVMVPNARLVTPDGVDILAQGITPDVPASDGVGTLLGASDIVPLSARDRVFQAAVAALLSR